MKSSKLNIFILAMTAVVMCVLFITRIVQLTVLKSVNGVDLVSYTEIANERSSITQARRGTIFDSKDQPIAMDTTSYSLFAILRNADEEVIVKDYDLTAKVLSENIDLTRDQVLALLRNPDANQVEFGEAGRNLSKEEKEKIEEANLPGVYFASETTRQYINDFFASHLIGYAMPLLAGENDDLEDAEILKGQLGIELSYDEQLSGAKDYREQWEAANNLNYLSGDDIYLTIDSRLQNQLEDLLNTAVTTYQPKEMGAYLVEVNTGKLIAAAQRPSFNLNTRKGIDKEWRNFLTEDAYEPGSTIKILTMSVAYDLHLYQPNEKYHSGTIEIFDTKINDHNLYGWGDITFEEGLARSSNTAMVTLIERLGEEKWIDELAKFGFGKSTNSGLINEIGGTFSFDNPVSRYMSSFGQAFSTTPIQLLQAFTSVANHGTMVKVQYIEGIGKKNNHYKVQELGQPISKEAADHVLDLMVDTVEKDYGTAKPFKSNIVKVAAKTGTAEIANEDGTGYLTGPNDYTDSVVAFFPADEPKYMMYLYMKQPTDKKGLIGSQILAQTFHPFIESIYINQ
ncbi:peptidoglycan D,D-transpeptidase FtsI family protein [Globicatella sulfidifaciens]